MNHHKLRLAGPVLVAAATGIILWVNAGDLNPPVGPIVPTMKTLVEVEPRVAVNATNTPGDAGATYKITTDGSYYLTEDLFGEVGKTGIEITASGVTLDLKGFTLHGFPGASHTGILGNPVDQHTLAIHNGTFRDWGGSAIDVGTARTSIIRDIRVIASGASGIKVGNAGVVERCACSASGASGIEAGQGSRVINSTANTCALGIKVLGRSSVQGCTAMNNAGNGIETAANSTVIGCTSNFNGAGIITLGQCSIVDCVANFSNFGDGISVGYAGIVRSCVATGNGDDGIVATNNGVRISDCSSASNVGDGIEVLADSLVIDNKVDGNGTGIVVADIDNRIDGNAITDSLGDGLRVTGTGNLIIRNSASGNAVDYNIDASNGDAEVLSPGTAFTATNPWANFAF